DKHKADKAFAAVHQGRKLLTWWTKWLDRVRDYIRPYYIQRGIIRENAAEGGVVDTGRRPHPDRLVADKSEPPLRQYTVSERCWHNIGAPKPGDILILRGNKPWQPFWIGQLIGNEEESGIEPKQDDDDWK